MHHIDYEKIVKDLRDSEEKFKRIFEYAPDAYYINDMKGVFIDGNKIAEKLSGYKKEELIGKSYLKIGIISKSQVIKAARLLAKNVIGKSTGPDEFFYLYY